MRAHRGFQAYGALPVGLDVDSLQAVDVLLRGLPRSLDKGHAIHALEAEGQRLARGGGRQLDEQLVVLLDVQLVILEDY